METFEFLLELVGGLAFLIGFGYIMCRLFKLDKYIDDKEKSQQVRLKKERMAESGNQTISSGTMNSMLWLL